MRWDREKERKAAKNYNIGMNVFAVVFSIFWCCAVAASGAWPMLLFGLGFLALTVYRLVISIKMTRKKAKETEPWEQPDRFQTSCETHRTHQDGFCPYCGRQLSEDFTFCPACGRRL